jgi:hypothetical protein
VGGSTQPITSCTVGLSTPKPNGTPPTHILSRSPWIQRVTRAGCAAEGSEMSRMRVGSWHRFLHTARRSAVLLTGLHYVAAVVSETDLNVAPQTG